MTNSIVEMTPLEVQRVDKAIDVMAQTQGGVMVGRVIQTEEIVKRVQEEGGNGAKLFHQTQEDEVPGNEGGHQIIMKAEGNEQSEQGLTIQGGTLEPPHHLVLAQGALDKQEDNNSISLENQSLIFIPSSRVVHQRKVPARNNQKARAFHHTKEGMAQFSKKGFALVFSVGVLECYSHKDPFQMGLRHFSFLLR